MPGQPSQWVQRLILCGMGDGLVKLKVEAVVELPSSDYSWDIVGGERCDDLAPLRLASFGEP